MQTPWGDCPVSDAHVHFFSRRFFAALGTQCGKDAAAVAGTLEWELAPEDPVELGRRWLGELDAHGVARAALIASMPGDEASVIPAVAAHPDRFYAYAMVNPMVEGAAVAPGLHGICLFPAMHCYSVQEKRVEALLEQGLSSTAWSSSTAGC